MPGVTPNLPHGLPPEPQVRGVVFLAFTEALHNLHLLADEDMQRFIQDVHYNGWYPFTKQQQVFDLIEARYPLSGPIMEKVGMGFINTIYSFQEWRHLFDTGIGFLKTNEASKLYYNFVQGHPQDIGSFTLIDLRAAEGKAVLHSTTPFSKDMERGILLRGLQLTRSFDYIDVDNAQDERIYHIEFLSATQHPTTPVSTIAASDFVGATHLTASWSLTGAELQKVFWRYKQLAKNLERQQAFWESTNETLVKAFVHLRAQERELQDKNRQLAQAHAASEMLKAGIVDAVPDALITINDASEIVEFSAGAEQIFGYRRADVLGRPISEVIIPPHLRERHWQGMQRYLTTGQATLLGRRVEIEAMRADGSLFPVELTIAAVHLASQRVFTAYVRDITERQRMERALRDSEQRFRGLAEVHPVPVCIVDVEKETFLYVSPCLAQLVGCSVEDLLARHPGTLFADPTEREVLRLQLRTTGAIEGYEFTLCRADGCTRPAGITARRIVYEGIRATVGAIVDLTERKRIEAELVRQREALYQSEKLSALGSLLAGVAHELNNPLSVVVGRAIMLEEDAPDPETAVAVGKIRQAAERCTRIVKTFLAMARQQQPERVPVHLNELLNAVFDLVGYGLRTAGITVHLDLTPDLPPLLADAAQLQQVFSNLFVNAQQALLEVPEPRWLRVATHWERQSHVVCITVTDNGPGVPAPIRSRIFDPFFTTKPLGVGTGVGLSLSLGIVTTHGGSLSFESPPAGGARFVVTLPLPTTDAPAAAETPAAATRVKPRTILVIDDEPEIAEMLSDILRRDGHQTTVVHSGNAALEHLATQTYDLVLSDLHMPDCNGIDLYRHLQESCPHILERLVFITGDVLGSTAQGFLAETGAPYLEKPIIPRDLQRLVQRLLA